MACSGQDNFKIWKFYFCFFRNIFSNVWSKFDFSIFNSWFFRIFFTKMDLGGPFPMKGIYTFFTMLFATSVFYCNFVDFSLVVIYIMLQCCSMSFVSIFLRQLWNLADKWQLLTFCMNNVFFCFPKNTMF